MQIKHVYVLLFSLHFLTVITKVLIFCEANCPTNWHLTSNRNGNIYKKNISFIDYLGWNVRTCKDNAYLSDAKEKLAFTLPSLSSFGEEHLPPPIPAGILDSAKTHSSSSDTKKHAHTHSWTNLPLHLKDTLRRFRHFISMTHISSTSNYNMANCVLG